MSIQTDLFTALKTLVSNRVYPNKFPQVATQVWPAIRYTFITIIPSIDITGDNDDSIAESRIQLDLVDNSFADVRALRLEVMAAMKAFVPPAILESSQDLFDAETKTDRVIMDYVFHPSSPAGSPN